VIFKRKGDKPQAGNSRKGRAAKSAGGGTKQPRRRRFSIKLLYGFAVLLVCGAIAVTALGFYLAQDLPDISDLRPNVYRPSVTVVASDGSTIANYGDVYGEWLEYKKIPPVLIQAVVATEDRRFFEHSGVDFRGLARALFEDILARHIVQGGSTITQQLAKNVFLTPERTIRRKVQEMFLAFWLEEKLTKQQILSAYLNRVFFGARSYGVDAAARTYFGHSGRHLSLGEAAMLAGLLKAPSAYAPTRDFEASMDRSSVVLDKMVEAGYITPVQATAAKDHAPKVQDQNSSANARYFTDWIIDSLPPEIAKRKDPLIVVTTLDVKTQSAAEKSLDDELAKEGAAKHIGQGALVAMGPDGAVRAMVGGKSYAESQYNRAAQSRRQAGSAFKLFVYLAALDAGLTPDDVMSDSPVIIDGWEPANYTHNYLGDVTLREAFAESINTVAVKVSETVDRQRVIDLARKMGITSRIVPHPSVALGTSELSLVELTGAYTIVGNGGVKVTPYAISEIRAGHGEILFRHEQKAPVQLIDPAADQLMEGMLETVVDSGTGKAARLGWLTAGKTGTTQDSRDAWFMGYSRDEEGRLLVAGVWMGNDDNSPMKRVTGGGAPAIAWRDFMQRAHDGGYVASPKMEPRMRPTPPPPPHEGLFDRIKRKLWHD
jgi:penicillin-binding protein 1A